MIPSCRRSLRESWSNDELEEGEHNAEFAEGAELAEGKSKFEVRNPKCKVLGKGETGLLTEANEESEEAEKISDFRLGSQPRLESGSLEATFALRIEVSIFELGAKGKLRFAKVE